MYTVRSLVTVRNQLPAQLVTYSSNVRQKKYIFFTRKNPIFNWKLIYFIIMEMYINWSKLAPDFDNIQLTSVDRVDQKIHEFPYERVCSIMHCWSRLKLHFSAKILDARWRTTYDISIVCFNEGSSKRWTKQCWKRVKRTCVSRAFVRGPAIISGHENGLYYIWPVLLFSRWFRGPVCRLMVTALMRI